MEYYNGVTDYLSEYIRKIESGEILACKKLKQFYIGIIKPILHEEDPRFYYDPIPGLRYIDFVETFCKQSKGKWSGQPLKMMLFQKAKYQCLFGIKRTDDDRRRFREVFDMRGRKNGKTTETAPLGLWLCLEERGAEIYSAATIRKQALRTWEEAKGMIDSNRALREIYGSKVFPTNEIFIKSPGYGSKFQVLSKQTNTQDGLNPSCAMIDEVHELDRGVYDILNQGMSAREEPIMMMITTAGFRRGGLFDDLYNYYTQILDGSLNDDAALKVMPLIYELDDQSEMENEAAWVKANPAIDVIKSREYLRIEVNKMRGDPNSTYTTKVKDFNIVGLSGNRWLDFETINNEEKYTDAELKQFDNQLVIGGYDLSRTNDLTAFTTLLFDNKKNKIIALTKYWCTKEFLDSAEAKNSKVPWNQWIDQGYVSIGGKSQIDYHEVANHVLAQFQKHGYNYYKIAYDRWSASYLVAELAQFGWSEGGCQTPIAQGAKTLSIPMQEMEHLLKEKRLVYQNNPVTKWMLSNIELESDRNGNLMPKKANENRALKIDGPATILNALVVYCDNKLYFLPDAERDPGSEGDNK